MPSLCPPEVHSSKFVWNVPNRPTFVLVVAIAAANGRVLKELLCIVPVAIDRGDHLSQLRQLFVVEGHKRLVVSLLSWRSWPLPRMRTLSWSWEERLYVLARSTYTHHRLQGGSFGVQNFDTSIALLFIVGHHTRESKITPKINWLCALGTLETWIYIFLLDAT